MQVVTLELLNEPVPASDSTLPELRRTPRLSVLASLINEAATPQRQRGPGPQKPPGLGQGWDGWDPRSSCGLPSARRRGSPLCSQPHGCPGTELGPGHRHGPGNGVCCRVSCPGTGPCRPRGKLETTRAGQTRGEHPHRTHHPPVGLGTLSPAFSGIPTLAPNPTCQKVTR